MCLCVCACEREKERERESKSARVSGKTAIGVLNSSKSKLKVQYKKYYTEVKVLNKYYQGKKVPKGLNKKHLMH